MKTQIIHLERHDTLISTQDKMAWGKTRRIVLVWPEGFRILNRRYDLIALNRYARQLGAQLGIVTLDDEVTLHASRLNIPNFRTIDQAQNKKWKESGPPFQWTRTVRGFRNFRRERPARDSSWGSGPRETSILRWFLIAVCAAGLAGILLLVLPSAQITIPSGQSIQQAVIPILASEDTSAPLPSGVVGYETRSFIVQGNLTQKTTGTTSVPDSYASGIARFTNLSDHDLTIPKGTTVRPLNDAQLRYVTTQAGSLPKTQGSTIDIPVQAILAGESYNLSEGQINAVEGSLGLEVSASNPAPIQGGTDRLVPAVTAADLVSLEQDLEEKLSDQAWKETVEAIEPGDLVSRSSLVVYRVITEQYDAEPGEAAGQISLEMKVEFWAAVIPFRNIQPAVQPILDKNLPDGYAAFDTDINVTGLDSPVAVGDGTFRWKLQAERRIGRTIEGDALAERLAGLKVQDAQQIVQSEIGMDVTPIIRMSPAWWPALPLLSARTDIRVVDQSR